MEPNHQRDVTNPQTAQPKEDAEQERMKEMERVGKEKERRRTTKNCPLSVRISSLGELRPLTIRNHSLLDYATWVHLEVQVSTEPIAAPEVCRPRGAFTCLVIRSLCPGGARDGFMNRDKTMGLSGFYARNG